MKSEFDWGKFMGLGLRIVVLAVILGVHSSPAHAIVGVSVVGAGTFASPYQKSNTGVRFEDAAKLGLGGGALLDFKIPGGRSAFEIGILYTRAHYGANEVPWTQVPFALRIHLVPFLSLGLGGYYGVQAGKPKQGSYSFSKTDYGGLASLRLRLPMGMVTSFIVDGRYLYGIKDLNVDTTGRFETRESQILAGLRFGI